MTRIETTAKKVMNGNNGYTLDNVAHYLECLFSYPENEWVRVGNKTGEQFTIFSQLADMKIICRRIMPIYFNGEYSGDRIEFMYNKLQDYMLK